MVNPLRRYSNPKYICTKQQIYKTCEVKTDRTEMINRQIQLQLENSTYFCQQLID